LDRYLQGQAQDMLEVLLEDKDHYLESLDQEAENWASIRYFTFRKMLREHGILVAGASKVVCDAHVRLQAYANLSYLRPTCDAGIISIATSPDC
jgi:hypothetical protein